MKHMLYAMLSVLVASGCDKDTSKNANALPAHTSASKELAVPDKPPAVSWTMKLDRSTLQIAYTVENKSTVVLYVVDKLIVPKGDKFTRTDLITVMNDKSGIVRFVLGTASPNVPVTGIFPATFRPIPPGTSIKVSLGVPYPLESWNASGGTDPIAKNARSAVLLLHYFYGEPPQWRTEKSDDAKPLKTPEGHNLQLVRVGPKRLPRQ